MTQPNPKHPTYEIFHLIKEGEHAYWTKIGVVWNSKDGNYLNIIRNYKPLVDGEEVFRKFTPKDQEAK